MAVKPGDAKIALVESAVAHVRERLPEPRCSEIADFVRAYYAEAAPEDLAGLDLYGAALSHWHLLERRQPGEDKVRVYTPRLEEHSWQSSHSVVEVVTDDMPFLVDSIEMALTRRGTAIHLHIHPVVSVRRDGDGRLLELVPASAEGAQAEALLHVQIDRQAERVLLDELAAELHRVLADVRAAVDDWQAMRTRARDLAAELDEHPPPVASDEVAEAKALLGWMDGDHFTFLGYRE
jgi:glutamate dehydrogenase